MTHKQVKLPLKIMADTITLIQKLAHEGIELPLKILTSRIHFYRLSVEHNPRILPNYSQKPTFPSHNFEISLKVVRLARTRMICDFAKLTCKEKIAYIKLTFRVCDTFLAVHMV